MRALEAFFRHTTKKCEKKKIKLIFSFRPGKGREGLIFMLVNLKNIKRHVVPYFDKTFYIKFPA